jgi:hypothetical protein
MNKRVLGYVGNTAFMAGFAVSLHFVGAWGAFIWTAGSLVGAVQEIARS